MPSSKARMRTGTLDPEGTMIAPGPEAYTTLIKNLGRLASDHASPKEADLPPHNSASTQRKGRTLRTAPAKLSK